MIKLKLGNKNHAPSIVIINIKSLVYFLSENSSLAMELSTLFNQRRLNGNGNLLHFNYLYKIFNANRKIKNWGIQNFCTIDTEILNRNNCININILVKTLQ